MDSATADRSLQWLLRRHEGGADGCVSLCTDGATSPNSTVQKCVSSEERVKVDHDAGQYDWGTRATALLYLLMGAARLSPPDPLCTLEGMESPYFGVSPALVIGEFRINIVIAS